MRMRSKGRRAEVCSGMEMIEEDWSTVKTRFEYWWANELYDRALMYVTAPRTGIKPAGEWPGGEVTPEVKGANVDYAIWRTLEDIRTTWYGGESLPACSPCAWSVGAAVLMGCEPQFAEDTVWGNPIASGPDYPPLRLVREGRWWKWARESTLAAARASQGRYFVAPSIGNHAGDALAIIRGSQRLMMDIALDPAWVRWAVEKISDIISGLYAELWPLVRSEITGLEGSSDAGVWSPGKTLFFNCDVSCMVSPAAFENIFLPPLVEAMCTVDHVFYELDGPGSLKHLETLLSVPEIDAFAWGPGAGHREILQWVPVIRRIQKAGKSVQVSVRPEEVEPLLGAVSAKGLRIATGCATEEQARDLIRLVARLSN